MSAGQAEPQTAPPTASDSMKHIGLQLGLLFPVVRSTLTFRKESVRQPA